MPTQRTPGCALVLGIVVLVLALVCGLVYLSVAYVKPHGGAQEGGGSHSNEDQQKHSPFSKADMARALLIRWQMNESVGPCQDFYHYACGGANANDPLVTFKTGWDSAVAQLNLTLVKILQEPIHPEELEAIRIAKTFFRSCMDLESIEALGSRPLKSLLQPLLGVNIGYFKSPHLWGSALRVERGVSGSRKKRQDDVERRDNSTGADDDSLSLSDFLVKFYEIGVQPLVRVGVARDSKNSLKHVITIEQPELNIDRHVYLDPRANKTLQEYTELQVNLTREVIPSHYFSETDRVYAATEVLMLEKRLANITLTPVQLTQDEEQLYVKTTIGKLTARYPWLNWLSVIRGVFTASGVTDITIGEGEEVVCNTGPYLDKLLPLLQLTNVRVLKGYFLWRAIYKFSPFLSSRAFLLLVAFNNVKSGSSGIPRRVVTCSQTTSRLLPFPVGRLYAERAFSPASREAVREMIERILHAFKERLVQKDWICQDTIRKALTKVEKMNIQAGSPAKYRNDTALNALYDGVQLSLGDYFQNIRNILRRKDYNSLSRLRKGGGNPDWPSSAATVNAFYAGDTNMIVFPAAMLQTPMFSIGLPPAINYGAIGSVIGHEITHGFDAGGRKYDANGNLKSWWDTADVHMFNDRARCLVNQYGYFKDEELNKQVDGNLTLDENIADNGGLAAAYGALMNILKNSSSPESKRTLPGLESFTDEQLFFLSFAQMWCGSLSPQTRYCRLSSDYHSLPEYRVLGALRNSQDFARAFSCPQGAPMNPHEKCEVW